MVKLHLASDFEYGNDNEIFHSLTLSNDKSNLNKNVKLEKENPLIQLLSFNSFIKDKEIWSWLLDLQTFESKVRFSLKGALDLLLVSVFQAQKEKHSRAFINFH